MNFNSHLTPLQSPQPNNVAGKGEIFLRLDGTAKKSGSTSELIVTNN